MRVNLCVPVLIFVLRDEKWWRARRELLPYSSVRVMVDGVELAEVKTVAIPTRDTARSILELMARPWPGGLR
jgi:hypothetical protein